MPSWVLTAGWLLIGTSLVIAYFALPKQIPVPSRGRPVVKGLTSVSVVVLCLLLAGVLWAGVRTALPDSDVDRCVDRYGELYTPIYRDGLVYCVNNLNGDLRFLPGD